MHFSNKNKGLDNETSDSALPQFQTGEEKLALKNAEIQNMFFPDNDHGSHIPSPPHQYYQRDYVPVEFANRLHHDDGNSSSASPVVKHDEMFYKQEDMYPSPLELLYKEQNAETGTAQYKTAERAALKLRREESPPSPEKADHSTLHGMSPVLKHGELTSQTTQQTKPSNRPENTCCDPQVLLDYAVKVALSAHNSDATPNRKRKRTNYSVMTPEEEKVAREQSKKRRATLKCKREKIRRTTLNQLLEEIRIELGIPDGTIDQAKILSHALAYIRKQKLYGTSSHKVSHDSHM